MSASSSRFRANLASPAGEALLVAGVIFAVYLALNLTEAMLLGAFGDEGVYTVLGKAIAEGQGYHSLYLPGAPVQVKYPPGLPLILALFWRLGGSVEAVQRIVSLIHPVVVAATAGLLWWIGRVRLAAPRGLLLLFVVGPLLFEAALTYYTLPLSEPWFMLGWTGSLALWYSLPSAPGPARLRWLVLLGLLLAATILIRTQAVVLLPAFAAGLLLGRYSWRERGAVAAVAVVPLLAWAVYHHALLVRGPVSTLPDEGNYLDWVSIQSAGLSAWFAQVQDNLNTYLGELGPYLSGTVLLGRAVIALWLGGLMLASLVLLVRQPVLALSTAGALLLTLLWPWAQDRLVLSVMPMGGLTVCAAVAPVLARRAARTQRIIAYLAGAGLVLLVLRQPDVRREGIGSLERHPYQFYTPLRVMLINSRFIAHAAAWLRAHTAASDRVMIDGHPGIYLYSGRQAVPANPAESGLKTSVFARPGYYLASRILQDSLTYLLVGLYNPGITRDLETVRRECPGVLAWGGASPQDSRAILRVRRDEACLGTLAAPASGAETR